MDSHAPTTADLLHEHITPRPTPHEPSPPVLASFYDLASERLHFQNFGPLSGIPLDDPALPELPRAAGEVVRDVGGWLSGLPERVAAVTALSGADERAYQGARLLEEVERVTVDATRKLRASIAAMKDTASALQATLSQPSGDELPPELRARVADHVARLSENERREFVRRAERNRDFRVLRALATDPLLAYTAPELSAGELVEAAGRLRSPRTAGMARAYALLSERLENNVAKLAERAAKAAADVSAGVDPGKLALVRRGLRGSQVPPTTYPSR